MVDSPGKRPKTCSYRRLADALTLATVKRALNTEAIITSPTDFDRNGRTNALDLSIVRRALNQSLPLPAPAAGQAPKTPRIAEDVLA